MDIGPEPLLTNAKKCETTSMDIPFSPFLNDMFSLVWTAFKNLYPDKQCECYWDPDIGPEEDGKKPYGCTIFGDNGSVTVLVTPHISVYDATEILAHELAHVAVGDDAGHGPEWESAFSSIHEEYNRIVELFDQIESDKGDSKT